MRVGFAGAGNMAAAMARGWAAGAGGPESMIFCDLDQERAHTLADEVGGSTRRKLAEMAAESDLVVLGVKPAALDLVASEFHPPALLSMLAVTPLSRLGEAFPGVPVLRLMPNQPVEVRRGLLCHPPAVGMEPAFESELLALLGLLGEVVEVDEESIDAAMAVMSCSPAYVALVAEALADAGEAEGLDAELSSRLVAETFAGTAELLRKRDPGAIRSAVAPPGGATEAGLEALEAGRVRSAFAAAVDASLARFR